MRTWKRRAALLAALALSLCLCACGGEQSSDGEWEGGSAPLESTELEAVDDSYEDGWEFEPELDLEPGPQPSDSPTYTFADGVLTCSGSGAMDWVNKHHEWTDAVSNATLEVELDKINAAVEKVVIEEGITSIGSSMFSFCSNLTEVILPDTLTYIGRSAFFSSGLTSIVIPDSVMSLDEDVFWGCANLNSIKLSNSLSNIPKGTFGTYTGANGGGATNLTSLYIPASVTSFGSEWIAIKHTPLTELTFEGDITMDQVRAALYPLADAQIPLTVYANSGTVIEAWITQKLPELCAEEGKPCNVTFVAL